jgi:hypothetical protein
MNESNLHAELGAKRVEAIKSVRTEQGSSQKEEAPALPGAGAEFGVSVP